jgi:hypothetical protein
MQPRLSGDLTVVRLAEIELPAVTIDRRKMSRTGAVDSAAVIEYLEREPLRLDSNRMQVLFDVEKGRVRVHVRAPDGKAVYRLDPAEDKVLKAYIDRNSSKWAAFRDAQLSKAMGAFFKSLEQLAKKGETSKGVSEFRDSVGLASAVADWGYMVELARTESGRLVLYPCVHQDKSGRLYFILPEAGGAFQLRGRTRLSTSIPFTGRYDVGVNDEESAEPPSERPLNNADEKPVDARGRATGKDDEPGIGEVDASSRKVDAKAKNSPADRKPEKPKSKSKSKPDSE